MSPDLIPAAVPRPAALVRDFVNTLDHELGTDELATPAGLTGFLMSQDLLDAGRADEEQLARAVAAALRPAPGPRAQPCRRAGVRAWPSTTCCRDLPVRLRWTADGVVAAPAEDGVAGALARVGLAALEARASEALVAPQDLRVRRVRVGLLRPLQEPVAALLRVRLRQQAQDPRLPGAAAGGIDRHVDEVIYR